MKNKSLAYKLLIFIGFCLAESRYVFSYRTVGQTLKHIDNIDCQITTLRKEFSLLRKNGLIEFKTRYRKPIPVLTQNGKLAIKTHLPFKQYGAWDQRWRMVIFDIPETERKYRWALRDKLYQLSFGQIQKSSYISPYPLLGQVNSFSSEMGIRQYLRLMEIDKIDDEKKLVEKTWKLETINEQYGQFIQKYQKLKKKDFWPLIAKNLEFEFSEIYENDPHLPEKFLPKNWLGVEAYKTFKEISNSY